MKERRKQKCGSRKDKGMKHSYVERLAALMLCAALLVSNAVISRADDDAAVSLQTVEVVNEEQNAETEMQAEGLEAADEGAQEEPSSETGGGE